MSEIFSKNCYTTRSSGYKYRTLSTNTGEKKHRDSTEDNVFDRKFKELRRAIFSRIDKELDQTQKARDAILTKFNKIDSKIDSMISLQENVLGLRKSVYIVENKLADILERVGKIELLTQASDDDMYTPSANSNRAPIYSEKNNVGSEVHVEIKKLRSV